MLTDIAIKAIKPTEKDQWICDGNGLYLRVRKTGGKSWVIRRKRQGHTRIITLGKYPELRLKAARLQAAQLGSEDTWSKLTLSELLDDWYEDQIRHHCKRPRQIALYLKRVSPELQAQKIREIVRADVRFFRPTNSGDRSADHTSQHRGDGVPSDGYNRHLTISGRPPQQTRNASGCVTHRTAR